MPKPHQFTHILREWAEVFMRRSMRDFTRFTKESGLSMPQVSVLLRLHYRGACGISELGEYLTVTNAAASQMIDKLVGMGLLERSEDASDRRAKQVTLTARGRELIDAGIEARRHWMEQLTTTLSREQQQEIAAALTLLTEAARQLEPVDHGGPK